MGRDREEIGTATLSCDSPCDVIAAEGVSTSRRRNADLARTQVLGPSIAPNVMPEADDRSCAIIVFPRWRCGSGRAPEGVTCPPT